MAYGSVFSLATLWLACAVFPSPPAKAGVVYEFSQVGSDVQMTAAGSIKTGSLTSFQTGTMTVGSQKAGWTTSPQSTEIFFGTTGDSFTRYNLPNGGFTTDGGSIGNPSSTKFFNTVSAGSTVTGFGGGGFDYIMLPTGYVSESAINATGTFTGTTIAGMGLIPGTYNWTWGGDAPDFVSVTVVPEPGAAALAMASAAAAVGVLWKRRQMRRASGQLMGGPGGAS